MKHVCFRKCLKSSRLMSTSVKPTDSQSASDTDDTEDTGEGEPTCL